MTVGAASRLDFRGFGCLIQNLNATRFCPLGEVGAHRTAPLIPTPFTEAAVVALCIAAAITILTAVGAGAGVTQHLKPLQRLVFPRRRPLPRHVVFRLPKLVVTR